MFNSPRRLDEGCLPSVLPMKKYRAALPQSAAPKRHFGSSTGRSSRPMQFENCHQMPARHDAMEAHEISHQSTEVRFQGHISGTRVTTMSLPCCINLHHVMSGSWRHMAPLWRPFGAPLAPLWRPFGAFATSLTLQGESEDTNSTGDKG